MSALRRYGRSLFRADNWGARWALVALALLVVLGAAFIPHFASAGNLWNVLTQVSTSLLVGVGMTLVLATGGVDLSVGSVMAVASAVAALAIPWGAGAACGAGLAVAGLLGAVNGTLVTRFGVPAFIATLAMLVAGRGVAQVVTNGGELIPFTEPRFEALGKGRLGPAPVPAVIALAGVAAGAFVLRATSWGRYLLAVGGNEPAARLAGVNVGRTKWTAYLVSGLLAGLAGVIETARLGATDPSNVGSGMEFIAIAGAVLGGTSLGGGRASIGGTLVGVLILAVVGTAFTMLLIPFGWALVLQAVIILAAVAAQRLGGG